jgi:hypothetical protein
MYSPGLQRGQSRPDAWMEGLPWKFLPHEHEPRIPSLE